MLESNNTLRSLHFDYESQCHNSTITEVVTECFKQNTALKTLTFNLPNCMQIIKSQQLLESGLKCLNCSGICSLKLSDEKRLIIKGDTGLPEILKAAHSAGLLFREVSICSLSELTLNLQQCTFECSHIKCILESLEQNERLTKLTLNLDKDCLHSPSDYDAIGNAINRMLRVNSKLKHFMLLGAVNDQIIRGLEEGLKTNCSVKVLGVEVCHDIVGMSSIANMFQTVNDTKVCEVKFYHLATLHRESEYDLWKVTADVSTSYLSEFLSIAGNSFFHTHPVEPRFRANIVHSGELEAVKLSEFLTENKFLAKLAIDVVNSTLIQVIVKELKENQTLQSLDIKDISHLNNEALGNLLQSLSTHSMIMIGTENEHQLCLYRNVPLKTITEEVIIQQKPSTHSQALFNFFSFFSGTCTAHYHSSSLNKALHCLQFNSNLKELTIQLDYQYLEVMGNALQILLASNQSLRVLKLHSSVSSKVIAYVVAGLKKNRSLRTFEVEAVIEEEQPVLFPLTILIKFLRICDSVKWNAEIGHWHEHTYETLCSINRPLEFEINRVLIVERIETMELRFPPRNAELTYGILQSIEDGCCVVVELNLVFTKEGSSYDYATGTAIERMLSRNSVVEKLSVMSLRNEYIEKSLLSGLVHSAKLSQVSIVDELHNLENSRLMQNILKADFTNSSINEMKLDDLSLHCERFFDADNIVKTYWKLKVNDKRKLYSAFVLLYQICEPLSSGDTLGESLLESMTRLDLRHSNLNLVQLGPLFEHKLVDLDLSYCTLPVLDLEMQQELKAMFLKSTTLKALSLIGVKNDTIATLMTDVLPRCSLQSLSLDLSMKFDITECLLHSFADSELDHLHFTNICSLHKEKNMCHVYLDDDSSATDTYQSLEQWQLLKSCSGLFVLYTLAKLLPRLIVSFNVVGAPNILPLKIFYRFIVSLKQRSKKKEGKDHVEKLLQSLTELHLKVTFHSRALVIVVINLLVEGYCPNMEALNLSHDRSMFCYTSECQEIATLYKMLLHSNRSLKVICIGEISDEIASGIASGLKHNTTLRTVTFRAKSLSITALSSVLCSVQESYVQCVHITEGCIIRRNMECNSYSVELTKKDYRILLCRIFCASAQVQPCLNRLLVALLPSSKLDLSKHHHYDTLYPVDITVYTAVFKSLLALTEETVVSELDLSGNDFSNDFDFGPEFEKFLLSDRNTLKTIRLVKCKITNSFCTHIAKGLSANNRLRTLDLRNNCLTCTSTGTVLESLTVNITLEELYLSSYNYDRQIFKDGTKTEVSIGRKDTYTAGFPSVMHLSSSETLCIHIAAVLSKKCALRVLSLQIKEEEPVIKLFESLEHNRTLEELDISGSPVETITVAYALQQMLKHNTILESLNMHDSGMSDEVCTVVAEGLAHNKNLKKLNLGWNNIGCSGVVNIMKSLENTVCCLQELDLSSVSTYLPHNMIERRNLLANNSTLNVLVVSSFCHFSEWLGIELFRGLKKNTSLCKLDISRNYLDESTTNAFADMLSSNTTITELTINNCWFNPWDFNLAEALSRSKSLMTLITELETKKLLEFEPEIVGKIKIVDSFRYRMYML